MGERGPIPKRSDEKVRRNVEEFPVEKVHVVGIVEPPELGLAEPVSHLIVDLYESYKDSAQARYYEPSDWHYIRMTLSLLNEQLLSPVKNGQIIASLYSALSNVLTTEGDRRRVRMEVERSSSTAPSESNVTSISDVLAERARQGA